MLHITEEDLREQQTEWERNFCREKSTKLYKYRNDIYRDLLTLQNNLIYVPDRKQLNDPNESCLNLSNVYDSIHIYESQYNKAGNESLEKEIRHFFDGFGVFSMCKNPKEECLWSYYSNGHRGFCIEYDAKILWDSFVRQKISACVLEVSYEAQREVATMDNIRSYIQKPIDFLRKTTSSKSIKWNGEQEVRFILNVKSQYINIPRDSVTGIYIGERCSDDDKILIKKYVNSIGNSRLKLYQMYFSKDSFDMYFEEIAL
jgi:hypothetical protein